MPDLLNAALQYAANGHRVFPCRGKQPITAHGVTDATDDELQIRKWWQDHPDANIGLSTAGYMVIDVDDPSCQWWTDYGADVIESATTIARTPSGGWHIYAAAPNNEPIRNSAGRVCKGIDIRGDGGYVIAPPSTGYTWWRDHNLADGPEWIGSVASAATASIAAAYGRNGTTSTTHEKSPARAAKRLDHGTRNDGLNAHGGLFRRFDYSEAEIRGFLSVLNGTRCRHDPLEAKELDDLARSAFNNYQPDAKAVAELQAAELRGLPADGQILQWQTLGDLVRQDYEWLWDGIIAKGHITLLAGHPKAGKTTLLAQLLKRTATGQALGRHVSRCRVGIVSEESQGIWAQRRDDLGIPAEIHITTTRCAGLDFGGWALLCKQTAEYAAKHRLDLVVFDTLAACWCVENENDASDVVRGVTPLRAITDDGPAVLSIHHARKGGGGEGLAVRGSTALTGSVDVIAEYSRIKAADEDDPYRKLAVYSRLGTVRSMVFEGEDCDCAGDPQEVSLYGYLNRVAALFADNPADKTQTQIFELYKSTYGECPTPRNYAAILDLGVERGVLRCDGKKRGALYNVK